MLSFESRLFLEGKTATGIQVPPEIVASLGSGKRPAVKVTINEFTYRSTVAPMGGLYWIPVSAAVRDQAGVAAGDDLTVEIELDEEPRTVEVPEELATVLAANPVEKAAFDALSYSNQRRIVLQIDGAKTDETRRRRIAKAIDDLSATSSGASRA